MAKARGKGLDAEWRALRAEARERGLQGEARRRWLEAEALRRAGEAQRNMLRLDIKILELRLREHGYESHRLSRTVQGERERRFHKLQRLAGTDWGRELEEKLMQLGELDYLLKRPPGPRRHPIYRRAFLDLQKRPKTENRTLAMKYFPNYFPDRAKYAIAMMKQGLRRERARRSKPLPNPTEGT